MTITWTHATDLWLLIVLLAVWGIGIYLGYGLGRERGVQDEYERQERRRQIQRWKRERGY